MTEITRSIKIKAPVNEVFAYASDYRNWTEFYEGVSDFKPITKTIRGNGTKFIYKAKVLGMMAAVGTEIREFKENEGWVGISFKGLEHETRWVFKKSNNGTEFTHSLSYKLQWYMGGNFFDKKFLYPAWIRIIENTLQNLKRIMEAKQNREK